MNNIKTGRLSTVCDSLLQEDIGKSDKERLAYERAIESINDNNCVIINEINDIRRDFLFIPVLIGFLVSLGLFLNDFIKTWEGNEKSYLSRVEYAKEIYGKEFYLNPKLPDRLKPYEYIADAEKISLLQYFHIRYMDNGFYKKSTVRGNLYLDGGFFLFFLTMISIFSYLLFFSYKMAPLVIDREKKVFYTWEKGNVYIARYTQLDVVHYKDTLLLRTYRVDESDTLFLHNFRPRIPKVHSLYIGKAYLLTFIAKYLVQGKDAVSSVNFQRQRMLISWLLNLRQEPKPTDWESQIEDNFVKLDKVMPPEISSDEETATDSV
ncbi:hypothetical protein [Xenorhabdus innexi]|uniref:Uncharacterized protein n=1 Tax=Xenorhabdus innexi TaxID=290109 RepID=A0A1N6N196_9GAMM|nr:hypothetical protein [Xenorhabdus innexi]PHM30311.1 hypothetical protein Xinn_03342 [Xenorhabdus innexi]SIP74847.1 conserved hypothetical protein [Xenorhabdus innexi]